ncbi:hypothetical protein J40TS1_17850 [Paenibacillus montaniterrae]|uniref:Uncharacterized protein n=1 Tax=Paenibacillus montaniterrae TaxID=429341 RepID=A0A919YSL1_9BACL|nr:hypothetical protein J40TS1_17850 [Paenibacillus montaniterrae]
MKGAAHIADESSAREKDQLEFALDALQAVRREDTAYSLIYNLEQLQLQYHTAYQRGMRCDTVAATYFIKMYKLLHHMERED